MAWIQALGLLLAAALLLANACGAPPAVDHDIGGGGLPLPTPDGFSEVLVGDTVGGGATPVAMIITPKEASVVAPGVTLSLRGIVSDEDDALSSLTVRWQTEKGAELATGTPDEEGFAEATTTLSDPLPSGITLIVIDPAGHVASDTHSLQANTPPGALVVVVEPASPTSGDDLLALITVEPVDAEQHSSALGIVYQWYVDDELAGIEGALVDASLTRAAQIWRVSARAYDGFELGAASEAEVSVGLAAPSVFIDAPLGADGLLTCAVESQGSLGEADTVRWYWSVGDAGELELSQTLLAEAAHHCDRVRCRVEVELQGVFLSSEEATLDLAFGQDCTWQSPCLEQACAPGGGCSQEPVEGSCDDGDACTLGDLCVTGVCVSGEVLACEVVPHGEAACEEGACVITACDTEWLDCDGEAATGCEVLSSDELPDCPS